MSSPLDEHLGPLLGRTHAAHREMAAEALAPLGLSPKGFGALAVLAADGPLSQRRLAQRQGIDRTTMVAVVDELERSGAVQRRRDAADRRAYALELTPSGARLLERAREVEAQAERRFLAPLSARERARLKEALRTLLRDAGGEGPAASRRGPA